MNEDERTESIIMGLGVSTPTCSIQVTNGNCTVTIEQSLEITWSGSDAECRDLVEWLCKEAPNLPSKSEDYIDGELVLTAEKEGKKVISRTRGDPQQPYYVLQILRLKGGAEYFDRTCVDRRKLYDEARKC
jgi:hypothetical protein